MTKTSFQSVDEYIASQPEEVRDVLKLVRRAIRRAVPKAAEMISYQIPAYKLEGKPVLYFAAWKRHYSLYPASRRVIATFQKDLAPFEVRKATIRFPFSAPVPVKLIERIAKLRAQESGERIVLGRSTK